MGSKFSQPLSAGVESQLQANMLAGGPETAYWDQGCQAGYRGAMDPLQSNSAVTVTGLFGAAPDVAIPARWAAPSLYVKTLIQGTGATMTAADGMIGNYVAYNWSGTTHRLLGSSYQQGIPSLFVGKLLPGLAKALIGQKAGSRVLAVIPPADGFGSSGNSKEGIGASDTLVFVVDIGSTFSTAGVPGTQASNGGGALPTVTPPAAGSTAGPAITIPGDVAAPQTLQIKTLITGTGPVVQAGHDLAIQYTGAIWRTGKTFDSSWSRSTPLTAVIGERQLIKGWDTGLVGQTVGSRVLLVVPPADGYGSAGASQAGVKGSDTLVFVVDILAATAAPAAPPPSHPQAIGKVPGDRASDP
jgi:FKBP-type peptidyl-prolyl cis-trans isomerase